MAAPHGTRLPPRREVRVCTYLRAALDPQGSASVTALRAALQKNETLTCRCAVRGVVLTADYVRSICVSTQVDACPFLDEECA